MNDVCVDTALPCKGYQSGSTPESRGLFYRERLQSLPAHDVASYLPIALQLFIENLRRYLDGEPLHNVVRPELGY